MQMFLIAKLIAVAPVDEEFVISGAFSDPLEIRVTDDRMNATAFVWKDDMHNAFSQHVPCGCVFCERRMF